MSTDKEIVAYEGVPGAYSHIAASKRFPEAELLGCANFVEIVRAVQEGTATHGLLPIENSTSGRVANMHHLLPGSGLHVIDEYFLPVRHCLIGIAGTTKESIREVHSHREALTQCTKYIHAHNYTPLTYKDTAGAVGYIQEQNDPKKAALASKESSALFPGTVVLEENVQDNKDNVTRFLVAQKEIPQNTPSGDVITSVVYGVRDIPAALYKSLSGFATTGVNIIKLESFVPMTKHQHAHFYIEFEGGPNDPHVQQALEELSYYGKDVEVLGTYEKSPFRANFE